MNDSKPDDDSKESLKDNLIGALHQTVIETQKVTDEIETGTPNEPAPAKRPENPGSSSEG